MDQSSISQNRRSRRLNVLLAASIEVSGATVPVKLRNLSTEGALIEGDGLPVEGSEVVFRRNDLCVRSRVAWIYGRQAGVAFRRAIAQKDVLRNIPMPKYRAPPDFRRPSLACRELTPEERRLVQSWAWTPWGDSFGE
ncbi:MAG TPA: PilZ domain-containing protein [Sphingomicrobium sp.]|nr:PilZ domain-containing protein [Sphingomicrobium sp.]